MRSLQPIVVTTFFVVAAIALATNTLASVHGWQFSRALPVLQYALLAGLSVYWLRRDQLARHERPVMDQSLLFAYAWPFSLPYYFFHSRGVLHGTLFTLGFTVLLALASVPAVVIAGLH